MRRFTEYAWLSKHFLYIAFKLKTIELLEKKKTRLCLQPFQKYIKHSTDICTLANIHTIVPKFIYVLCKYVGRTYQKEFNEIEIIETIQFKKTIEGFDLHYFPSPHIQEWVIDDNYIWSADSKGYDRKCKIKNFDMTPIHEYVAKEREKGIIDPYILTSMIDTHFSEKPSHFQIGEMFPANPCRHIKNRSKKVRGQRLRRLI